MSDITLSPLFGIALSAVCFEIGVYLNKKTGSPIANPLLVGIILCIAVLKLFNIPFENFNKGGEIISMMLAPVTALLSVTIYNQLELLKKNLIPIIVGALCGSLTSVISAVILCRLFGLNDMLTASIIPKSVTTPIAMEISAQLGGNTGITVAAVVFTGILGAVLSPLLIKIFKIKNPIASGVAIGTASHAVGTSRAIELGETEGAMSGVSIGIAGIITVIIAAFL